MASTLSPLTVALRLEQAGVIIDETSERDEFAAIGGVEAAGLRPEPAEPLSDWDN